MKTYNGYAYVVSEASDDGMQILDLGQLAGITNPPIVFSEAGHYDDFGSAQHLVVNESTGYAYAVGSNTCSGGLHMIDLASPAVPVFAGCFSADGYTQDAQCVSLHGSGSRLIQGRRSVSPATRTRSPSSMSPTSPTRSRSRARVIPIPGTPTMSGCPVIRPPCT